LLETVSDKKMRLKRIEKKDSIYYGIKIVKSREVKFPFKGNEIKKIRVKDNGTSTFLTIGAITLTLGIIVIALLINDLSNDLSSLGGDGN
jgi:hypothetical protein